jgi:hypothetical protein
LFQVDVSQIVVHEAEEPNAVVDLFDAEPLAGEHGRTSARSAKSNVLHLMTLRKRCWPRAKELRAALDPFATLARD